MYIIHFWDLTTIIDLNKKQNHTLDTLALYELSLAAGGSTDSQEHISRFLNCLIEKKKLSYVSLWTYEEEEDSTQTSARLLFSHPQVYVKNFEVKLTEDVKASFMANEVYSISISPNFTDIIPENLPNHGSIAYIPMGAIGVLKIYDAERESAFTDDEFLQLNPILENFSHSLDSCLTHQQRMHELNEQSHFATKLRSMIDATLDGFIIINSQGQIAEWNYQAETIFGWTREEIIGKKIGETIIPNGYCETHKNMFELSLIPGNKNTTKQRIEIIVLKKNGQNFPIELSIVPVKTNDGYIFCGYIRDITTLKNEEKKRQQLMDKLEHVNHELNDFAHVVSHDLKAPLRAIKNLSDWISTDYEDKLGEEGQQQFELLKSRVDRMKDLINGILEYSQMGRLNSEEKIVDLNSVLAELIQALDPPENIQLKITKEMPHVFINEISLMQIFQNLISNALKYIDKPIGEIEIGYKKEKKNTCFWIKDNGPGIAEKDRKRIFRIFETLGDTKNYESTGVGLAIVKKILANYRGEIWLTSTLGEGSCFYFTLPNKRIVSQTEHPVQA